MDTKFCSKCQTTKSVDDFHKKHGKLVKYCAVCQNEYSRSHYQRNKQYYLIRNRTRKDERRQWLLDFLKDKICEICGENRTPCLDFDHVDPLMKSFNIGQGLFLRGLGMEQIVTEIEKCRILCANCHRLETAKQFSWYKQS